MPYRTWVNNTTPAINQDNLNTIQESLGYINVKDRSLTGSGAKGDGTTDDRAAIQAAIDALPAAGGVVYFPQGIYKVVASGGIGLNLTNKDSITLQGENGVSFNDGNTQGTRIVCGSASMTLISCEPTSNKVAGPAFRSINFDDGGNNTCKLVRIKNTNHWSFRDCAFRCAGTTAIGLELDVASPGDDNNWNNIDFCRFTHTNTAGAAGYSINSLNGAFYMRATTFNLNDGMIGLRGILGGNCHVTDCYWVGATSTNGRFIYWENGLSSFKGCVFENLGGGSGAAVQIVRPGSPTSIQGRYNMFIACHFPSGTTGIQLGSGTDSNVMIGNTFTITTPVSDSGSGNFRIDNDVMQLTGWSGGLLGAFGASPVAKQTVTGSRGGNAALASLCTALANYGLITNSTS